MTMQSVQRNESDLESMPRSPKAVLKKAGTAQIKHMCVTSLTETNTSVTVLSLSPSLEARKCQSSLVRELRETVNLSNTRTHEHVHTISRCQLSFHSPLPLFLSAFSYPQGEVCFQIVAQFPAVSMALYLSRIPLIILPQTGATKPPSSSSSDIYPNDT